MRKTRENQGFLVRGIAAFTTTGTTVEVNAGGLSVIEGFALSLIGGTYDADDLLSLNESTATDTDGVLTIPVPADGNVTVLRNSSGQSGRAFSYVFWGY